LELLKRQRRKIFFAGIIALLLVFIYLWEGNTPAEDSPSVEPATNTCEIKDRTTTTADNINSCTITIKCDTILNNMAFLEETKRPLVPRNGTILPEKEVTFNKGESVFDVLVRETKNNGIHMEFVKSPVYGSAYIEGIHNLYEFDCGELSGWMYSVNGWFPNYGCSDYILSDGDYIEWVYTCDLGNDVK